MTRIVQIALIRERYLSHPLQADSMRQAGTGIWPHLVKKFN